MPDPITLAALERRNRAAARAGAIWSGACSIYAERNGFELFGTCLKLAEREYEALLARCINAEPPTDETEFAYRGEPMKPG